MQYAQEYVDYLYQFHVTRDYFECHEVLETLWKSEQPKQPHWALLIQLSVSMYHYRSGNVTGAYRLMKKTTNRIPNLRSPLHDCGLDVDKLLNKLERIIEEMESGMPYQSFNLPFHDTSLLRLCQERALQNRMMWGNPSDINKESLIHKHKLRYRETIINKKREQRKGR